MLRYSAPSGRNGQRTRSPELGPLRSQLIKFLRALVVCPTTPFYASSTRVIRMCLSPVQYNLLENATRFE
eukprot:39973-Lingulodinium_polyedra.AAC.1